MLRDAPEQQTSFNVGGSSDPSQSLDHPWLSRWRAAESPPSGAAPGPAPPVVDLREAWELQQAAGAPGAGAADSALLSPPGGLGPSQRLVLRVEKVAEAVTEVPDVEAVSALRVGDGGTGEEWVVAVAGRSLQTLHMSMNSRRGY